MVASHGVHSPLLAFGCTTRDKYGKNWSMISLGIGVCGVVVVPMVYTPPFGLYGFYV